MIDLHIYSDISGAGKYSVKEMLQRAKKAGLDLISFTDQNNALSSLSLENIDVKKYYDGEIITGIEVDTCYKGITFEVVGYGFNPYKIQEWAYSKFGNMEFRQKLVMKRLREMCDKLDFKYDEDFEWEPKNEFAHINMYRNLKQYSENEDKFNFEITSAEDFYRNSVSNPDFVLYLNMSFLWPTIKEVVSVIHSAHGKVFLADPYDYRSDVDVDTLLDIARKNKVDGVEVYLPNYTPAHILHLKDYCIKHKLLMSGGSRFPENDVFPYADATCPDVINAVNSIKKGAYKKSLIALLDGLKPY